jgi:hypothetical protein
MTLPGYTAEASLYRTSVHYRGKHHAGRQGYGNLGVAPQACSGFKVLVCNPAILACNLCLAFFPSVPLVLGCYAACLGGLYAYCGDCLDLIDVPSNGGGGSGGGGCCPRGRRCCGSCASGTCDDVCVGPGQSCP